MELIGWLGSLFLSICGIPMAVKSWRDKHSDGVSHLFLWFWFLGEVLLLIYVLPKLDYPLIMNFAVNIISVLVIIRYKYYASLKGIGIPTRFKI